jgi:2-amino-4-hydroxy-6-hydroxymethyldihydropteridine diphosphokinase
VSQVRVVIGLGSNLGDRVATLHWARGELARLGRVVSASALYETAPVGPPQPTYLNAAVLLETELEPRALLDALLAIERSAGRERRERWGPRTLDLDILWADGWLVREPDLGIPHRELCARAFALVPLLDVVPEACDPETRKPYSGALEALDRTEIRELLGTRTTWTSSTHR